MNIHEYQGKELLKKFGVVVPRSQFCQTVDEAVKAIRIGLEAGKMHIAFPAGFGFILRLLSGLPAFLQRTLLRRMVRS